VSSRQSAFRRIPERVASSSLLNGLMRKSSAHVNRELVFQLAQGGDHMTGMNRRSLSPLMILQTSYPLMPGIIKSKF
jgi:hypothetical protein